MPAQTFLFSNGSWRQAKNVYINVKGSWTNCKEVWVNTQGTWNKVFELGYEYTTSISGYNFNLYNSAIASGWDGVTPLIANLTLGGNLGSTVNTQPAWVTGGTLPSGSTVSLTIPSGLYLVGRGGDGGGTTGMGALVLGNWVDESDPGLHYIYLNGQFPGQNICSSPMFAIQPSTSYVLTGKVFSYGVTGGGTAFDVLWYDASGNQISTSANVTQGNVNNGTGTYARNAVAKTVTVTSPSNAAFAVCRCYSIAGTTWANGSSNMVVSNWSLGGQMIVAENNGNYVNGQAPLIAGRPGGPAITATYPMTIINNGVIGGGGGGGGMGGANPPSSNGGGGAGFNPGLASGSIAAGAGSGGAGGAGGNLGQAGAAGSGTTQTIPGGAAGAAVLGSGNVTFQVYGSVLGALS